MTTDANPPELASLREVEELVQRLVDELAAFRKRAHVAETRLKEIEASPTADMFSVERNSKLEAENADLRARLESSTARTKTLLERMRFLRQQHERAPTGGASR